MDIYTELVKKGYNLGCLTKKHEQTDKKIAYIKAYVVIWMKVMSSQAKNEYITFIDSMCNAGIYSDGDLGTVSEVCRIFIDECKIHTDKQFRLLCNDKDVRRIEILKEVISLLGANDIANLHIDIKNLDVNDYITWLDSNPVLNGSSIFYYNSAVLLFVDPFDSGTVQLPLLSKLLNNKYHYLELLFNCMSNDFVRNIKHDWKGRLSGSLGRNDIKNEKELIQYVRSLFKVGCIQYVFGYQFKNSNNAPLYYIIFATPNIAGLSKLKEALWNVFHGDSCHRNRQPDQPSLFTDDEIKEVNVNNYAVDAMELLKNNFSGACLSWSKIKEFIIENTMMTESQIIDYILKPMIESGEVKKMDRVSRRKYIDDEYVFR